MLGGEFQRGYVKRFGPGITQVYAVFIEKIHHGGIQCLRRPASATGIDATAREILAGDCLGNLALAAVVFIHKQDVIGLRRLGIANSGKHGLFANILGLVRDPFQLGKNGEYGEHILYLIPVIVGH